MGPVDEYTIKDETLDVLLLVAMIPLVSVSDMISVFAAKRETSPP